jgi:hypothetical protein
MTGVGDEVESDNKIRICDMLFGLEMRNAYDNQRNTSVKIGEREINGRNDETAFYLRVSHT